MTITAVPLERYGVADREHIILCWTLYIGVGGRHMGSNSSNWSNGSGTSSQVQRQQKTEFYRPQRWNFIKDRWRAVGRWRRPAEMFVSTTQQHEIVRSLLHTRVLPHPRRFQIHHCDDGTKEVERRTHLCRRNDGVAVAERGQDSECVQEIRQIRICSTSEVSLSYRRTFQCTTADRLLCCLSNRKTGWRLPRCKNIEVRYNQIPSFGSHPYNCLLGSLGDGRDYLHSSTVHHGERFELFNGAIWSACYCIRIPAPPGKTDVSSDVSYGWFCVVFFLFSKLHLLVQGLTLYWPASKNSIY